MDKELQSHVKPGEFTFCGRCGETCRAGKDNFMCAQCKMTLFPRDKVTKLEMAELRLEIAHEQCTSHAVRAYRRALAALRRDFNG